MSALLTSPSARFYDAICRKFSVNSEWPKNGKIKLHSVTIAGLFIVSVLQ